jgi:MFS transporter, ACDE family, multidrug resistance protein
MSTERGVTGTAGHGPSASPFRQPKAVWAVAFACVVSFMGIGLVDPILPALASQLKASPSSVELLFTSYLVVTAVAMLITGWVSSRIGGKRTLVAGLILIVVFSALAGSSHSIGQIIGFRAGWGLGNALFIATSLAVIIGAASGGFAGAIILYETALGIGIALGPLVGGELGAISWRGPFFGVTVLMSISLIATLIFVDQTPRPERKTSVTEPLRALRHRGLATMSLTALLYNWGFFTLLAFTPFPMHLGIHELGYVFTAWGILVAIFAVFVAPRAQRRFGTPRTLYVNLALLAIDLAVIAAFTSSQATLIVAVIVSGAFVGLNNTLTTQAVMLVSPVERPVASAAYGFVRFIGGGLAPFVAARLAADINVHVPFWLGAATVAIAIGVLASGHRLLTRAEQGSGEIPDAAAEPAAAAATAPIVVAVGVGSGGPDVTDAAIGLGRLLQAPIEVVHVLETDVVGEQVIDAETAEAARCEVHLVPVRADRALACAERQAR